MWFEINDVYFCFLLKLIIFYYWFIFTQIAEHGDCDCMTWYIYASSSTDSVLHQSDRDSPSAPSPVQFVYHMCTLRSQSVKPPQTLHQHRSLH